jgi:hypothetical protein
MRDMNLLDLMSVEYRRSRRALYASLGFNCLLYFIVLGDALSEHRFSEMFAVFAFVLQIASVALKYGCSRRYESAEEIRRIAVLKDGLGIEPSELSKAEIVSRVGTVPTPGRIFVGSYFASEKAPGVPRFLDDLSESAFWTCEVAQSAARVLLALLLLGSVVSVFSLLGVLNAGLPVTKLKIGAEVFVVTLAFVVTGELLLLSLDYFALSQKARRVMTSAFTLLESNVVERDAAILLFGEYNCALSATPALPTFLYGLLQTKLNAAWSARKAALPVQ